MSDSKIEQSRTAAQAAVDNWRKPIGEDDAPIVRGSREHVAPDLVGRSFVIQATRLNAGKAQHFSTIERGWTADIRYAVVFAFHGDATAELKVLQKTRFGSELYRDLFVIGLPNECFTKGQIDATETTSEFWGRKAREKAAAGLEKAAKRAKVEQREKADRMAAKRERAERAIVQSARLVVDHDPAVDGELQSGIDLLRQALELLDLAQG